MDRPLAYDLFAGLGGWTRGLLKEGYRCIGVDNERHEYDGDCYPAELWLRDIRTVHGSELKDADLIVTSSPCNDYSYMAMPFSRGKAKAAAIRADETGEAQRKLNELFDAQFRIQREASEAAGRYIPMVAENVRGAEPWVGKAKWSAGSMCFWGDLPALMPDHRHIKVQSFRFDGSGRSFQTSAVTEHAGRRTAPGNGARFTSRDCGIEGSRWFNDGPRTPDSSSSSPRRKEASAKIAMIPEPIARWIGRAWLPPTEPPIKEMSRAHRA